MRLRHQNSASKELSGQTKHFAASHANYVFWNGHNQRASKMKAIDQARKGTQGSGAYCCGALGVAALPVSDIIAVMS